jgi:hypothetical protein
VRRGHCRHRRRFDEAFDQKDRNGDHLGPSSQEFLDVDARAARRIEDTRGLEITEQAERRWPIVERVVRSDRSVFLVLRREGVVLGWVGRAHRNSIALEPARGVLPEGANEGLPTVAGEGQNVRMTTPPDTQQFDGATFVRTSFRGAVLRSCDLSGVTMRSVEVGGLDLDSHDLFFGSLIVNGVDVVPFVDAELNRQFPGRELQKAETPEGLRDGWVAAQAAWDATVTNTPPELVDAHVDDEWSLAQTLRHLVLATDAWLRGGIMGIEQPFHEIGMIFTGAAEMGFDMSIFRTDEPSFDDILAARTERQQMVTDFLDTATPELLAEERNNPWGGDDWHPTVGDCVRVILEEEWAHLRYVRRDLALLG